MNHFSPFRWWGFMHFDRTVLQRDTARTEVKWNLFYITNVSSTQQCDLNCELTGEFCSKSLWNQNQNFLFFMGYSIYYKRFIHRNGQNQQVFFSKWNMFHFNVCHNRWENAIAIFCFMLTLKSASLLRASTLLLGTATVLKHFSSDSPKIKLSELGY